MKLFISPFGSLGFFHEISSSCCKKSIKKFETISQLGFEKLKIVFVRNKQLKIELQFKFFIDLSKDYLN